MGIISAKSKYSPKVRSFLAKQPFDFPFFTLACGAVRSAKTVTMIQKIPQMFDAIGNDYIKVFSGFSKQSVKTNVLTELQAYIENNPLIKGKFKYNSSSGELDLKFWGKLYSCMVFGAGKAGSDAPIQGGTWDFWYANELPKHHYTFYNMALSRLSAPNARAFADANPESQNHWLYVEKIKPYLDSTHEDHEKVKSIFEYWHFIMDDNANLCRKYVEDQKKLYSGAFYDRKILGQWKIAEGLVYDTFSEEKHVVSDKEIKEKVKNNDFLEYIAGIDWGFNHPTAVTIWGVTKEGFYYLIKTLYKSKLQPENVISWIKGAQTSEGIKNIRYINADNARPECNDKIRKAGYLVHEEKPIVEDSIAVIRSIINYDRMFISDECKEFLNEIICYRYPSDDEMLRASVKADNPVKENDDLMDSMRYILNLYEHRFGRKLFEAYTRMKKAT